METFFFFFWVLYNSIKQQKQEKQTLYVWEMKGNRTKKTCFSAPYAYLKKEKE